MAKKKRTKQVRKVRRARRTAPQSNGLKNKTSLVVKNLLLFVALSLVFLVLYRFLPNLGILSNTFYIMTIAFGFVAIALLIALLVLWILKKVKK